MTLFCVSPGCSIPRQHITKCTGFNSKGEPCRGCLPAEADAGQICTTHLTRTANTLAEVVAMHARLVTVLVPPTSTGAPRVSGTPPSSAPLNLDAWDLLAAGNPRPVHDEWHDQTGNPSVSTVLWLWAQDWRETRAQRETQPDPDVPSLAKWLANRLEWAAEEHPAVDEFIRELGGLYGRLLAVLGETERKAEPCLGIPCRYCRRPMLFRRPDGSGDVDCRHADCQAVYRADEYHRWTIALLAQSRQADTAAVG